MRTLELNETELWYVEPIGKVEVKDDDGYFTGELETSYSNPIKINLHLYPASGDILERTFGLSAELDFVTNSNIKLEKDILIFRNKPTGGDLDKYDFTIDKILPSLNNNQYGLKGRR